MNPRKKTTDVSDNRPNKPKNGGITAGISRAGPGRDAGIGNGADSGAEVSQPIFSGGHLATIGSPFPLPLFKPLPASWAFLIP